jgi:CHAT domain-containing protein
MAGGRAGAGDAERDVYLRSERDRLAEALASYPPEGPDSVRQRLEQHWLDAAISLDSATDFLPFVRCRLAREADYLRSRPSVVDYYNYCGTLQPWWDRATTGALEAGDMAGAWRAADDTRARTLDLLSAAVRDDRRPSAATYVPDYIRDHHARMIAEVLETLGDEDNVDLGLRRDALMPWLNESFGQAASWRGHWVVDLDPTPPAEEFDPTALVFPDVPTALIEFWCAEEQAQAFIHLPGGAGPRLVALPDLVSPRQIDWFHRWFTYYGDYERRGPAAIPAWARFMDQLCLELGQAIWAPLREVLEAQPLERLILVPDLFLGSLPLHAMALPARGDPERLCDRYDVGFCPSLRQLGRARRHEGPVGSRCLFLGDPQAECPTGKCPGPCRLSLPMSRVELETLRTHWPEVHPLVGRECTPKAALERLRALRPDLIHVSTHGLTRFDDPLGSGLVLRFDGRLSDDLLTLYVNHQLTPTWGTEVSGEVLTLDTLLRQADLRSCRLLVLNACETGLGYMGSPREDLGLATGLLAAGVPSVIAPLWYIGEAAASLLTQQFYARLRRDPSQKLAALMYAQRWLRRLGYDEAAGVVSPKQLAAGVLISGRERPFSHPFFWAPLQLRGSPL